MEIFRLTKCYRNSRKCRLNGTLSNVFPVLVFRKTSSQEENLEEVYKRATLVFSKMSNRYHLSPFKKCFLFNYKPLTSASFNNIADKMVRTNKHALRKVTGVYTERTVTLLLKLSVISSVR